VLAQIAAYQDAQWKGRGPRWGRAGAWCIVRQREIIAWWGRWMKRQGYPVTTMSRSTLNYQLAGLRRERYMVSEQRHLAGRGTRKLVLRPSLHKFTALGRLWIKQRLGWVTNPVDLSAVRHLGQSGFNNEVNSSTSLSRAVDKAPTALGASRQGKSAALRRRTRASNTRRAAPAPGKALSRRGSGRATIARAARKGHGRARTPTRRKRRS
jgi:hypothetical protein